MAPTKTKRADSSKVAPPAKKAKVETLASGPDFENPLARQFAPIFSALSSTELPENCCDIFRVALPLCVGVTSEKRHSYQNKMLDLAASSLQSLEAARRAALAEVETKAENLKNEGLVARADAEAARGLAAAKQQESDAKGAEAGQLANEVDAAKLTLTEEVARKEAFLAHKASLVAEQEGFQKILETIWEPLKVAQWPGHAWRKRDKALSELTEQLKALVLDESLVDALLAAMKLKPEQRQSFAQRALAFAEEAFAGHTAALAEKVAGTGAELEGHDTSVAGAEAKLVELQARHAEKDKECDELQNGWAELETAANKAQTSSAAYETEIQAAFAAVDARKADLDATLAVLTSFAVLRDSPAPQEEPPLAPEAPPAGEPLAPVEPAPAMEFVAEAVAVCA